MDEYLEELESRYGCYNNKCKPNCRCNKCYYIGARGLMEPVGPQGATVQVRGVSAELIGSILREILNEANVIFNNIINNQSQNISYSRATGEFTISATGNYYVLGG